MTTYDVGILGNTNIDLIMGPLPHLPSFGRELVVPAMETRAAGAAGNTAMALDRLGLTSVTVGAVGEDPWAGFIRSELARCPSIDLASLETAFGLPTGLSVALLDQRGERGFVTCSGALNAVDGALLARHEGRLLQARYVLICGYFFMPLLRGDAMRGFLQRARVAGCLIMLDTGWDLDDWPLATRNEVLSLLPHVDIFAPNEDETHALVGDGTVEQCAVRLLDCGAHAVAIKLGALGSLWASGERIVVRPAPPATAVDSTGAGDSFNAALIYGMAQGWDISRTLSFANAFCSIVVSRLRDRFPSVDETLAVMSSPIT
jgi:sugar/nucleoside kinase (ribokinase family)